jgi:hypothetical protein
MQWDIHCYIQIKWQTWFISLISKEANKNKSERDIRVDIPFEEWGEGENTNIYITGQRVVNNTFYKLICDGKVYNNGVKSCEKDGIIKFTYENKTKLYIILIILWLIEL